MSDYPRGPMGALSLLGLHVTRAGKILVVAELQAGVDERAVSLNEAVARKNVTIAPAKLKIGRWHLRWLGTKGGFFVPPHCFGMKDVGILECLTRG